MLINIVRRRGVAPIVSTLLIMVITMIALTLTLGFTQTTLTRKNGEADFESAKSFMRTLGLQVDDVAWVKGRVDTVHFTSQYGQIEYLSDVIRYKLDFYDGFDHLVATKLIDCDIFMYDIPTEKYFLENGYYKGLIGDEYDTLVFTGVNAPVTRVFVAQDMNVGDAYFVRIVLVPALRLQSYEVASSGITNRYVRVFVPDLRPGYSSAGAKTVVLTGVDIDTEIHDGIKRIDVSVSFLRLDKNYDNNFFKFSQVAQSIVLAGDSYVEIYSGQVRLDYGA